MKGYKAFNENLCCKGFQYEIGKVYEHTGKLIICKQGFHFCDTIADTYNYYPTNDKTRICEIEALGEIQTKGNKHCTNRIKIVREITDVAKRKCNVNNSSTGFCNTGNYNTGDLNTGDYNTGNFNTGNYNTGSFNTGNFNTGNWNIGYRNAGDYNKGNYNVGHRNTGDSNTGNWNTGSFNTGDWNTKDWNTGSFNTKNHIIYMFDNETNWYYTDWLKSKARHILNRIPKKVVEWIFSNDMTNAEKAEHPEYKTVGGYLKVLNEKDSAQLYWDGLSEQEKQIIYDLPNFDADIFEQCTGISIGINKK